jgi:DNA-binding NarL/FixJ family response regulator
MTRKVLIVDDSKLARMTVRHALHLLHANWPCTEASNADDALHCVAEFSPDIVLLDFNMPGKDGIVLAQQLRELHPQICVAVISANRQNEVILRVQAAGATYIPKPLAENSLKAFLDAAYAASVTP